MAAEKCTQCGKCNAVCPVYRVLLDETKGPRTKISLRKDEFLHKVFFQCTLCGRCELVCPAKIKITHEIEAMRRRLISCNFH